MEHCQVLQNNGASELSCIQHSNLAFAAGAHATSESNLEPSALLPALALGNSSPETPGLGLGQEIVAVVLIATP